MIRRFTWILALVASGCAAGENQAGVVDGLGADLPPPSLEGIGPLHATAAERDPVAKADALQVTAAHPRVYAVTSPPPAGSQLVPEWAPGASVLVAWHDQFAPYFMALVGALAASGPTWVITADLAESEALEGRFAAAGVDTSMVLFFEYAHEAFWTRDFGPWSVVDPAGALHFVDPSYYPTRFRDDALPTLLAEHLGAQVFRPDLDAEGGNIMTNGAGLCVTTGRLTYNNPPNFSFDLADLTLAWLGCARTVFLEPLDDERTGHVDLLAKFLSPDLVAVSAYDPVADPENARVTDEAAARLANLTLADGRALRVVRVTAPPSAEKIFRTYTNALQTDRALFVPIYDGHDVLNAAALDVYRAALPESVSVIPINASSVVEFGGAVHCTTMQVHYGARVAPPDSRDGPVPWGPPAGALGEEARTPIEADSAITRVLRGQLAASATLGRVEIHLEVEGRTPNQVRVSLSHGDVTTLLHDGPALSVLEDMPRRFATDAFVGAEDVGEWRLTMEVEAHHRRAGLHRWFIRPVDSDQAPAAP